MMPPFEPGEAPEAVSLQRYEGLPNQPDRPGEKSAWKSFLTWMLPWLRRKRELADDYLEAEVLDKKATALTKIAEAELRFAEARKIAVETAELTARMSEDKFKLHTIPRAESEQVGLGIERLEAIRDEIDQKINVLRTVHGGSINLAEEDAAQKMLPPASTSSAQDE